MVVMCCIERTQARDVKARLEGGNMARGCWANRTPGMSLCVKGRRVCVYVGISMLAGNCVW